VRPIYEDNKDCVLLYACGWSEYTSLPSNSHIKYNCPGTGSRITTRTVYSCTLAGGVSTPACPATHTSSTTAKVPVTISQQVTVYNCTLAAGVSTPACPATHTSSTTAQVPVAVSQQGTVYSCMLAGEVSTPACPATHTSSTTAQVPVTVSQQVTVYNCMLVGWSEYTSLPSNSHIKYNCPGTGNRITTRDCVQLYAFGVE
jgi:hypothetical protein